jgi:hypothetical protein
MKDEQQRTPKAGALRVWVPAMLAMSQAGEPQEVLHASEAIIMTSNEAPCMHMPRGLQHCSQQTCLTSISGWGRGVRDEAVTAHPPRKVMNPGHNSPSQWLQCHPFLPDNIETQQSQNLSRHYFSY